jgi:hypothetical protein
LRKGVNQIFVAAETQFAEEGSGIMDLLPLSLCCIHIQSRTYHSNLVHFDLMFIAMKNGEKEDNKEPQLAMNTLTSSKSKEGASTKTNL